jgi:hypothetical protein
MKGHRPLVHQLTLGGAAICSLFAGHMVQYQLLVPDPVVRSTLLDHTGHSYLPWALPAAIAVGVLAAGAAAVLAYAQELRCGKPLPSPVSSGFRIATGQVGAFLLLETAERMAAGAPLDNLGWRALLVSTGVQLLGAGVATLALVLIGSIAAGIARIPGSRLPRRDSEVGFGLPPNLDVKGPFWAKPFAPRGPPQLFTA